MSWYKSGTIAATNGSKIITGAGTQFTNSLNGVSEGRMLLLPAAGTVQIYEIESVQSDTQLTLVSAFTGTTGTGKTYAIPTSPAVSIEQFAHEFAATLAYYQQQLSGWQQILTGTGNVTLTTPDGEVVTVRSQQAWDAALSGKANSSDVFLLKGALGTNDLNNVIGTDYQGIWWQNATANATVARNYPVVSAGNLLVLYNSVTSYGITQIYITHVSKRIFIRSKPTSADAWTAWGEFWTSDNLVKQASSVDATSGRVLTISNDGGSFGLGGAAVRMPSNVNVADYLRSVPSGFYSVAATAETVGLPPPVIVGSGYLFRTLRYNNNPLTVVIAHTIGSNGNLIQGVLGTTGAVVWNTVWDSANLNPVKNASSAVGITSAAALHTWALDAGNTSISFRNDGSMAETARFGSGWFSKVSGTYSVLTAGSSASTTGVKIQAGDANGYVNYDVATLNTVQTFTAQKYFTAIPTIQRPNWAGFVLESTAIAQATVGRRFSAELYTSGLGISFIAGNGTDTTGRRITALELPNNTSAKILVSGGNAIADSNGFWKTASPVVKLFTEGTSELTSEAEGITTERLSEGVYRISGCLGLNADRAWGGDEGGIDVPMCRNKLPRLWVDYGGDEGSEQINPDGSIVIRTYHRPHPDAPAFARNEIEGYANGDPIDIPHDTFISVRVQMPEREEEKPKVMHSNVYYNTVAG